MMLYYFEKFFFNFKQINGYIFPVADIDIMFTLINTKWLYFTLYTQIRFISLR